MKPKILFIRNGNEKFVEVDRDLLAAEFPLVDYPISNRQKINPWEIWKRVGEATIVFSWFASWHSYFPLLFARLQKKSSILVIGGYDTANLPKIGYGHQRGGFKKWISRMDMQFATRLIVNSNFSWNEAQVNAGADKQKLQVIYHGFSDPYANENPTINKENLVISVGRIDWPNLGRKGHELFVRTARQLPDIDFKLIGIWADDSIDYLKSIAPSNLQFTGRVAENDLLEYYRKASVYVQLSQHEAFGCSVAEAMLAGCVPVVSHAGALPEVVGDCGFSLANMDVLQIAAEIKKGLLFSVEEREKVRRRILVNFPLKKRKVALYSLVGDLDSQC
jgi:glycosyltransferase involved in cell wall biosynthesis